MTIEEAIEKASRYMGPTCLSHDGLSPTHGICWTLKELETLSGASARALGKARKHFRREWAQALPHGDDFVFSVQATTIYGKVGIVVNRFLKGG